MLARLCATGLVFFSGDLGARGEAPAATESTRDVVRKIQFVARSSSGHGKHRSPRRPRPNARQPVLCPFNAGSHERTAAKVLDFEGSEGGKDHYHFSFSGRCHMGSLSVWVDESEKNGILVVAGVLADWTAVPSIIRGWWKVKAAFGLPPKAEIKSTLPDGHPTREALKAAGIPIEELCVKATEFIAGQDDLSCIAVVMVEKRNVSSWKKNWPKANVRDFYCEALKYIIQRAAEEVVEAKLQDCVVVCDTPELGKDKYQFRAIKRGKGAVEEAYQSWYWDGVSTGPGMQYHQGPLADIGFHPSVLIGDATYHDMLQIADAVAGVTSKWVDAVHKRNKVRSWEVDRFKTLSIRFRKRHGDPGFFGGGFVLWPKDDELWALLQKSVGMTTSSVDHDPPF